MITVTKKQKNLMNSMENCPNTFSFLCDVQFEISSKEDFENLQLNGIVIISSNYMYLTSYKSISNKKIERSFDIKNYRINLLLNRSFSRYIILINIDDGSKIKIDFKDEKSLKIFSEYFTSFYEEYKQSLNVDKITEPKLNFPLIKNSLTIELDSPQNELIIDKLNDFYNPAKRKLKLSNYGYGLLDNIYLVREELEEHGTSAIRVMNNSKEGNILLGYIPDLYLDFIDQNLDRISKEYCMILEPLVPSHQIILHIVIK